MKKIYSFALALLLAVGAQADLVFDLSTADPGNVEIGVQAQALTLTGTLPTNSKLIFSNNVELTLQDVTIIGSTSDPKEWAGITCLGNATIHLSGTNVVKGFGSDYAGIFIPFSSTLTIDGDGSLEVSSPGYGAAIGANKLTGAGHIIINGGVIDAKGGIGAAAIGGVTDYGCGEIRINGGTVAAKSFFGGAAIGGGYNGYNGNIIIANTVYKLTAEIDEYSVTLGSSVIGFGGGSATSYTVMVGGVDYGTTGVTTNPFVYNPGEQAEQQQIAESKAQLLGIINEANLIVNYIEADDDFDAAKADQVLYDLNGAIDRSLLVYNNADAGLLDVGNAMTDIFSVAYDAMEAVFAEEKRLFIVSIEALLEEGDSEACRQIVANKAEEINTNVVYVSQLADTDLSVQANLDALDDALSYDAFMEVKEALRQQREKDKKQGIDYQMVNSKDLNGKFIKDGQLFIEINGNTYNAQGIEVK